MALAIREELAADLPETARLANIAFGSAAFFPERLAWLYGRAFSGPATVIGLFDEADKVGQVVLIHQRVRTGGAEAAAVGLIDLFILPSHRSRAAIGLLYGAVERLCAARGLRFILAVPNGKAAGVNERVLGMGPLDRLDIRAGLAGPFGGRVLVSAPLGALGQGEAEALFARHLPGGGRGIAWTAADLWQRLQDPQAQYGLHATADVLLVSAKRTLRRVPHVLLCAFLVRDGVAVAPRDMRAVTAAACRLHRRPLFVYAGLNAGLPLPGRSLPERLRPSPMRVQIRDFAAPAVPIAFERFELIDFDFA